MELYLARKIRLVEASAYLDLTLPAVLYRVLGDLSGCRTGGSSRPIA